MSRRTTKAEPPQEIEISIDALVLHGLAGVDRQKLETAMRGELGRLLQNQDLPDALRSLKPAAQVDLGSLPMRGAVSPAQLGTQVARALVRSWQPAPAPEMKSPSGAGAGQEKGKRS